MEAGETRRQLNGLKATLAATKEQLAWPSGRSAAAESPLPPLPGSSQRLANASSLLKQEFHCSLASQEAVDIIRLNPQQQETLIWCGRYSRLCLEQVNAALVWVHQFQSKAVIPRLLKEKER